MRIESGELHGYPHRRGTRLVVLLACIGGLAGCAGSAQTEPAPATAQTEPEPNSVLEKNRDMALSREGPAPTPEVSSPQQAEMGPTPGNAPALQPTGEESGQRVAPAETIIPADPALMKEDEKAIEKSAATSKRLANQTAGDGKTARERATVPAGLPKSTGPTAKTAVSEQGSQPTAAHDEGHAADNTGRNKRDRNDATLTPTDQSNDSGAVQLTAKIRRAVMDADGLSFAARNVKIITADGQVTLRGPVKSAAEKSRVEQVARQAAGSTTVVSKLEIEK